MKPRSNFILLGCILLCIILFTPIRSDISSTIDQTEIHVLSDFVDHVPIEISSDADFSSQGWPGSGTENDPYLIIDLRIVTSYICINVTGVSAHFEVSHCLLESTDSTSRCIYMKNVSNAHVDHCQFTDSQFGFWMEQVDNCTISNNTLTDGDYGIFVRESYRVGLYNNSIARMRDYGIFLYISDNCTIRRNHIDDGGETGLYLYEANHCLIENNTLLNNGYSHHEFGLGMQLGNCFNDTILNNTIIGSRDYGLWMASANNCTLQENVMSDNGRYDVHYGGSYGTIIRNDLEKGIRMTGDSLSYWQHVVSSNIVREKQLAYFWDLSSLTIDIDSYGQVILANCNNVTLEYGNFSNVAAGVQIGHSTDCNVRFTEVTECDTGLTFYKSTGCMVCNSTIGEITGIDTNAFGWREGVGLYIFWSAQLTVENTTLYNCSVSGAWLSYSQDCNFTNNKVIDNQGGAFTLSETQGMVLFNNTLVNNGVVIQSQMVDDWHHVIENNTINGLPIGYYWNITNEIIADSQFGQLILAACENVSVIKCNISGGTNGITLGICTSCVVFNSTVYGNSERGVWVFFSQGCIVENNSIYNNGHVDVDVDESDFSIVGNNTICSNSEYGVKMWWSHNSSIHANLLNGSGKHGLYSYGCEQVEVFANNVTGYWDDAFYLDKAISWDIRLNNITGNSGNGFYCDDNDNCEFRNNWIVYNSGRSIELDHQCSGNTLYDNTFGTICEDDGESNNWDDGISVGNAWRPYNGEGEYLVHGSANSIDHYPRIADFDTPSVDSPDDIIVELGTEGQLFMWNPSDDHPGNYTVYKNGSVYDIGSWLVHGPIVDADGLEIGNYNFTAIFEDMVGKIAKDTVWVRVLDTTSPIVEDQTDLVIISGVEDVSIAWTAEDLSPHDYEVYFNGIIIKSGLWNSSPETVTFMITEFELGEYNYTIVFRDSSGNSASDTVWVTILAANIELDSPPDMEIVEGTTGNSITWTILNGTVTNYKILRNGSEIISGPITSMEINANVDYLIPGNYNFTIVVEGLGSTVASDTVWLSVVVETTVTTQTTTATTSTSNGAGFVAGLMGIIITIGSVAIIIVVGAMICKTQRVAKWEGQM